MYIHKLPPVSHLGNREMLICCHLSDMYVDPLRFYIRITSKFANSFIHHEYSLHRAVVPRHPRDLIHLNLSVLCTPYKYVHNRTLNKNNVTHPLCESLVLYPYSNLHLTNLAARSSRKYHRPPRYQKKMYSQPAHKHNWVTSKPP